jgi:hypothetical protein
LGEIEPLIVLIKVIFDSEEITSPCAGKEMAKIEVNKNNPRKR